MKIAALALSLAGIAFVVWEEVESRRAVRQFWIDRAKKRTPQGGHD